MAGHGQQQHIDVLTKKAAVFQLRSAPLAFSSVRLQLGESLSIDPLATEPAESGSAAIRCTGDAIDRTNLENGIFCVEGTWADYHRYRPA